MTLRHRITRLQCWWLGCEPDWRAEQMLGGDHPCVRCGELDISYRDRIGDTRHRRMMDALQSALARCWIRPKCPDCGKRYGRHDDCLPF